MTLGQAKKTAYAFMAEYSKDESLYTDDEELQQNINLIANICYHELAGIKPIYKTISLDRSLIGTTEYYRAYDMPNDMKTLDIVLAYDEYNKPITPDYYIIEGVAETSGATTTYKDKIYINDLSAGTYYIKYYANPTDITESTKDSFELELDKDAQTLLPFAIASDILKSDDSIDYNNFRKRYEDQLMKLNTKKTTGIITIDTNFNTFNEF